MKSFVKINNWWWEFDPCTPDFATTIYNKNGEVNAVDIRGEETAKVESATDLDWYGTKVWDNEKYKTGWLSPDGEFFGCDHEEFANHAKLVQGKTKDILRDEGWVVISLARQFTPSGCIDEHPRNQRFYVMFASANQNVYPTDEQLKFIMINFPPEASDENKALLKHLVNAREIRLAQLNKI